MSTQKLLVDEASTGQTAAFSHWRVLVESGTDSPSIHITSLWKIPSIDLALIKQAALGIPPQVPAGPAEIKERAKESRAGGWSITAFPIDPDATLVAR